MDEEYQIFGAPTELYKGFSKCMQQSELEERSLVKNQPGGV